MEVLERWLSELSPQERILDLGCGSGSMRKQLKGLNVIGIDVDPILLSANRELAGVCGRSHRLPFAEGSFDLVISHHSLEHFRDAEGTIREIGRVLKPAGRLFVSVPEGASFSDRLYRLMFCGGDHWQRFSLRSAADAIEAGTGLHLAASKELFTSFLFVDKRNFLAAPIGPLPGPLPRRMRWMGCLPAWCFAGTRWLLNIGTRLFDRCFPTSLSRYGWALAFGPEPAVPVVVEPGCPNVCMHCGLGIEAQDIVTIRKTLYRCPDCSRLNFYFPASRLKMFQTD
jgi:SAM-dependent methyltransferase